MVPLIALIFAAIVTVYLMSVNHIISGRPADPADLGRPIPAEPSRPQDPVRPGRRLWRHRVQGRQRIREPVCRAEPDCER
jgi:hypothetical protein